MLRSTTIIVLSIVVISATVGRTWAQSTATEPRWQPIDAFGGKDKGVLKKELGKLWGCGEPDQNEPDATGSNFLKSTCNDAQAAAFAVGERSDLIVVMIPSMGNRSDFQFSVLGPANSSGRRSPLGGRKLSPACGEEVRFAPAEKLTERSAIIFVGIDRVSTSGHEHYDDERWEWTGTDLVFVKTLKRIDR
jgi:hypothetical protein